MSQPETGTEALSRRRFMTAAVGGAIAAGAVAVGVVAARSGRTADRLIARHRPGELSTDPLAALWGDLPAFEAKLQAQQVAPPVLAETSVDGLLVRAAHDGSQLAFHLEWRDSGVDELEVIDRFRDAVAVQLPLGPGEPPSVTMGGPGKPVHILQWKASWQADIDTGLKGVKDAFPNAFNDVYPELLLGEKGAAVFYPGRYVGNPLSARTKPSPVEEMTAEGFGTLTTLADQAATGKGVFADGAWKVVIALPMQGGEGKAGLQPGATTRVAFAAWNGGSGDRGSRKQWADWTALEIEGAG